MRRIIVVLGAGRSGTSLLMNLISDLGVSISENLVGPSESNKKGAFEDQDILGISRGILRHYNRNGSAFSFLSMPENWVDDSFSIAESKRLKEIVKSKINKYKLWGFKEPVTAKLLPMWNQIFDDLELCPIYALSLRHPASVSESFKRAYGVPETLSSLIWISRYCDAILNTNANFRVYDYDEWFHSPDASLSRLLEDLDVKASQESISIAKETIDINLKTAGFDSYENNQAIKLYNSIIDYRDERLSKSSLIDCALEACKYLSGYDFFSYSVDFLANKNKDQLRMLSSNRRDLADLRSEVRDLKLQKQNPFEYIEKKRAVPYEESWRVVAGVASFKAREHVFEKSIASVKEQFDHIYVYLNGYNTVPDYLDDSKFTVFLSQDFCDLSANGKIFSLGKTGSCYFFTLDDDILYPNDYVEKMICCMSRYNNEVGVTVHGSILPDRLEWYYERYSLYPFQKSLMNDTFVNLIGSGTFAFHTDILKASAKDFFPDVMVDLQFSILAKNQCIPLVAIARPEKWLTALVQGDGLYQSFLFRKTIHTEKAIENAPWGFSVYSEIVWNRLHKWKRSIDFDPNSEIVDRKFFQAINDKTVPDNWRETDLYYSKIEEREFIKQPIINFKKLRRFATRKEADLKELKRVKGELSRIKRSRVYRFCLYLARAIKFPGKETVKFPVRFLRLLIKK